MEATIQKINPEPFKKLAKVMKKLPIIVRYGMIDAYPDICKDIVQGAKLRVGIYRHTGELERNIDWEDIPEMPPKARVYSDAPYAGWHEYGGDEHHLVPIEKLKSLAETSRPPRPAPHSYVEGYWLVKTKHPHLFPAAQDTVMSGLAARIAEKHLHFWKKKILLGK